MKLLVFEERGKPEFLEKNLWEQGRKPTTNSTHTWHRDQESNLGHIGRRLLQGCFLMGAWQPGVLSYKCGQTNFCSGSQRMHLTFSKMEIWFLFHQNIMKNALWRASTQAVKNQNNRILRHVICSRIVSGILSPLKTTAENKQQQSTASLEQGVNHTTHT